MRRFFLSAVLLATLVVLAGCGGSPVAAPSTVPVSGKVVLASGSPLPGGRITFHPQQPGGQEASGEIKPDGSFSLTSFQQDDGAMPGDYTVSVELVSYSGGTARPVRAAVPKKYLSAQTSGLVQTARAGQGPLTIRLQ